MCFCTEDSIDNHDTQHGQEVDSKLHVAITNSHNSLSSSYSVTPAAAADCSVPVDSGLPQIVDAINDSGSLLNCTFVPVSVERLSQAADGQSSTCTICQRKFTSLRDIEQHMPIHAGYCISFCTAVTKSK